MDRKAGVEHKSVEKERQPEQMFLDLPLEQAEQIDGRFPAMVVGMIRDYNCFSAEKDRRGEIDIDKFVETLETKLKLEARLASDPKYIYVASTREDHTFAEIVIDTLEKAFYLKSGAIVHKRAVFEQDVIAILKPMTKAIKQAVKDYGELSTGFKAEIAKKYPDGAS